MIGLARQAASAVVIGLVGVVLGAVGHAFATARPDRPLPPCLCGHSAQAHEHYRRGIDCGECGPDVCDRYDPATPAARREHDRAVAFAEARPDPRVDLLLQHAAERQRARERARADAARGLQPLV